MHIEGATEAVAGQRILEMVQALEGLPSQLAGNKYVTAIGRQTAHSLVRVVEELVGFGIHQIKESLKS